MTHFRSVEGKGMFWSWSQSDCSPFLFQVFKNHNSWLTGEVRTLLRAHDVAFTEGALLHTAWQGRISPGASVKYRQKLNSYFMDKKKTRLQLQGFNIITDYKNNSHKDHTLPDRLNDFWVHFKVNNSHYNNKAQAPSPPNTELVLRVTAAKWELFTGINPITSHCEWWGHVLGSWQMVLQISLTPCSLKELWLPAWRAPPSSWCRKSQTMPASMTSATWP